MHRPTMGLFARAAAILSAAFLPSFNSYVPPPRRWGIPPAKPKGRSQQRRGRSNQLGNASRLIVDRSSSVKKLQRWARNGTLTLQEPTNANLHNTSANRRKVV